MFVGSLSSQVSIWDCKFPHIHSHISAPVRGPTWSQWPRRDMAILARPCWQSMSFISLKNLNWIEMENARHILLCKSASSSGNNMLYKRTSLKFTFLGVRFWVIWFIWTPISSPLPHFPCLRHTRVRLPTHLGSAGAWISPLPWDDESSFWFLKRPTVTSALAFT